jgi:hypothetical protein
MRQAKSVSPKAVLPGQGEAFLMPLPDGRYSVCRVIRQSDPEEEKRHGVRALVAASSWIGEEAPDVNEPLLRDILALNHHAWDNRLEVLWVSDPIPSFFRRLGTIEPSHDEKRIECFSYGGWESLPAQAHMQWRWDNEREAVLQEDARQRELERRKREESTKRYQEYLDGLTLERLKKKRRFSEWKGFVSDKIIAACRRIFRETIDSVVELGANPKKRAILAILQRCVERLNELDEQYDYFIMSIERDDLCEEFYEIVHASGLRGYENLADQWREW